MTCMDSPAFSKGFSAYSVVSATTANPIQPEPTRVWPVGTLCLAIGQALDLQFNPVQVVGEISGFSRAASGHCYFLLKDAQGQIRCAMFRRVAMQLDFSPQEGERVEVAGQLGVYEQRGDLQLVVQNMVRAGQGVLYAQFLQRKARLAALGLFDASRKRALPAQPRGIGLVTSLGAAALHDVISTLQRRVPHIPVLIAPALVQGAQAPAELIQALSNLYHYAQSPEGLQPAFNLDVILLVRGGGSLEDLWAFNDEALVQAIAQSPVPVVSGVGHETDFTLADFVADLRAPTPTAAAELVAPAREVAQSQLDALARRLQDTCSRQLDRCSQQLDGAVARLGRPSGRLAHQQLCLAQQGERLRWALLSTHQQHKTRWLGHQQRLPHQLQIALQRQQQRLERAQLRLDLLNPRLVLQRGYAWLTQVNGSDAGSPGDTISRIGQTWPGQQLRATLVDGELDLQVLPQPPA